MQPIIMAAKKKASGPPPITFTPVPGSYSDSDIGSASYTISASEPVVWNWSRVGSIPTSTVANGGTASSITFSLTTSYAEKDVTITLTSGGNAWTIHLNAAGFA